MALCQHCGDIVSEADINYVCLEYPSDKFPGTFQEWCSQCRQSDEMDLVYDEAARRRWARVEKVHAISCDMDEDCSCGAK